MSYKAIKKRTAFSIPLFLIGRFGILEDLETEQNVRIVT